MSMTKLDGGTGSSRPAAEPQPSLQSGWLDLPAPAVDLNGPQAVPYPAAGTDWIGHSILDHFRRAVETGPDRIAVDDGERRLTRSQLWNGACRLAAAITAETPPGPIGILLPNEARYAIALFACLAAGRACVVLDRHYPAARNGAIIAAAGLAGVIIDRADAASPALHPPGLAVVALDAPAEPDEALIAPSAAAFRPDDPAVIVYTSGSTGEPKGIVLSQRAILHRAGQLIDSLHIGPHDVALPLGSPCTVAGMLQLFETVLSGASLLIVDLQRVGLGAVLDAIDRKHATLLFATPALLRVIARLDGVRSRLASLRSVHPSGEVLLAADLDLLRDCLPPDCSILLVYGLTEAPAICQWFVPRGHAAAGARVAVGYGLPGYDCAILAADGAPVGPGETGELVVRSRFTALGDWRGGRVEPAAFAADPADPTLRILRTGDLAWVRGDGAVVIVGRKDRQVQIHGMRVEPYEIENALRGAAGVLDAAVVARHDGEVPILAAFVVMAAEQRDSGLNAVRAHLQAALPAYMHPARVTPIEALPLLPGHKVDAEALVALDTAFASGTARSGTAPAPRDFVTTAWRALLGAGSLDADAPFCEAGGDSLALLQLVFHIEEACGTKLPFASFSTSMRPSEMTEAVAGFLAAHPAAVASPGRAAETTGPIGRSSPLVLLSPGERGPPIFMAHGLGGHVGELAELARHLRTGHPIYALQAAGIGGGQPSDRIEDIAQYFCGAIEAVESKGPYLLIGYSLGGLIMLEVAESLRRRGREVRLLAMLDTFPHPRFWPLRPWLSFLAQRALHHGGGAARMPLRQMIPRLTDLIGDFVEHLVFRAGVDRQPRSFPDATTAPALRRMQESLTAAEARYRPRRYSGELTFFRADSSDGAPGDPRLIWGALADRIEVITVPGCHVSMIFTGGLAARLSDRLEGVFGENR